MECHFFHTSNCRKGDKCNFAHTEPKLGYCPKKRCPLCPGKEAPGKEHRPSSRIEMEVEKPKEETVKDEKKEEIKEFKGKLIELPKWEEKEPGTKLLPSVV